MKSRGCRKLKRRNTAGVPMYMSVARFTGVVPLLLLLCRCCTARMLLKFRGSVGWNCPLSCSGWHARIRTHARTETRFAAVAKIPRSTAAHCCTMAPTTSKAYGVIQVHSSSRQHSKNEKTAINAENCTSPRHRVPGSYCRRVL